MNNNVQCMPIKIDDIATNESNRTILQRLHRNFERESLYIQIGHPEDDYDAYFDYVPEGVNDMAWLGYFVRKHDHLKNLYVTFEPTSGDSARDMTEAFIRGATYNNSIERVNFTAMDLFGGEIFTILTPFFQHNYNLTQLTIQNCNNLGDRGGRLFAAAIGSRTNKSLADFESRQGGCTNLKQISIRNSNMSDEQLVPISEAVRGHPSLEYLDLSINRIGNGGCDALATLLRDPNSNLHALNLMGCAINDVGANSLANSLANNTKLKHLNLTQNPIDPSSVQEVFSKLLCNTSSINDIYSSNHTLQTLQGISNELDSLLKRNKSRNKSRVATKKILKYHPNIDMEPFFGWNLEGEGERDLKALPYVVAWYDRAAKALANHKGRGERYKIGERKLSGIYQFAQAMPLLFVPVSHVKGDG